MKSSAKLKVVNDLPFKIESGIPITPRRKPNPFEAVFKAMKRGDSFLIDGKNKTAYVLYQAQRWGKQNGSTFAFRTTSAGVRCWKIK